MAEIRFIKLPKELDHSREGLINIHSFDNNQSFICCLIRYLNPDDQHPARIRKNYKLSGEELGFKETKLPVKIRDIHKIEKNSTSINVFDYENNLQKTC